MALGVRRDLSLVFFCTLFFVRIFQNESLTLWPVDSCPGNLSEVEAATLRRNCSDVREFRNVYHCLPLSNLSRLVEFCFNGLSGLIEGGNCMILENQHLNNYPCNQFSEGCPKDLYFSKHMFNYPSCIQINKQNSCYIADPSCPIIKSFLGDTTIRTVKVKRNVTVPVQGMTMPTIPTKENSNPTNNLIPALFAVVIVLSVALVGILTTLGIKHRKSTKQRNINQVEGNHILPEEMYPLKEEESAKNGGVRFDIYNSYGAGFIQLQECLINEISKEELVSLKDYLKRLVPVKSLNKKSLRKANSVKKFIDFLISEGIFVERDMIVIQGLMRMINRSDLDKECVRYATKKKERVCYFTEKEPVADGSSRVELHVVDDIEKFTTLASVIETVAAMLNCDHQSIDVVGIHPDSSFIIVMEMERNLAQLLSRKTPHELTKLAEFKIDRINIDGEDITIAEPGNKEKNEDERNNSSKNIEETGDKKKIEDQPPEKKEFNEKSLGENEEKCEGEKNVTGTEDTESIKKGSENRESIQKGREENEETSTAADGYKREPKYKEISIGKSEKEESIERRTDFNRTLKNILQLPGDVEEVLEDSNENTRKNEREAGYTKKTVEHFQKKESTGGILDADSSFASQVQHILSCECANLFRKILRKYAIEEVFISRIQKDKEKLLPFLSVNQQNILFPEGGRFFGNYKSLDLPLMYILFQKACFISMKPHKTGWGSCPDPSDSSLAANIESIMEIHKDYSGESPLFINQSDFDRIVKRIVHLKQNIEDILKGRREYSYEEQKEKQYEQEMEDPPKKKENVPEKLKDESLSNNLIPPVVEKFGFTVPGIEYVNHISYVTSDRLWVSDHKVLLKVDYSGHIMQRKKHDIGIPSADHSVTEAGDLLYIDDDKVQKMTPEGRISTLVQVRKSEFFCLHYSRINGNLLVGKRYYVMRFDRTGERIKAFMKLLGKITCPLYIAENRNGDIWVSGNDPDISDAGAVEVVDRSGRYRFDYVGQQSQPNFNPRGICTDILGRALVCDDNFIYPSIHLLDQDGQFLCLLLTREHGLHHPIALCLDYKNNLFLGQRGSNKVMVYDYLQGTDDSVSLYLRPTPTINSSFTVSMIHGFFHISCGTSDRFWVNDYRHLIQVNSSGHEQLIEKVTFHEEGGVHAVTADGDLLFVEHSNLRKMTADGSITTLINRKEEKQEIITCVHSSRLNGDILLGCVDGVLRYDKLGKRNADFRGDFSRYCIYPMFITENKNGDIWLSDFLQRKVVAIDKSGHYRLDYKGQHKRYDFDSRDFLPFSFHSTPSTTFKPCGICTDILGQVLVCDFNFDNPSVHLLDQDGQFLRLLLTREHGIRYPRALCVDDKHNLYVGQECSNRITVYKYLQETEDLKTPIVESK